LRGTIRQRKVASVGLLTLCTVTAFLWLVLLRSIGREQAGNYIRTRAGSESFGIQAAFDRIQEVRQFTVGLFDPVIAKVGSPHFIINPLHNARYIGATLIPLLACAWVLPWRPRQAWLLPASVLVLSVCLGPPFLLELWDRLPMMNRVEHLFYFYSHFFQIVIALMAAVVLDNIVEREGEPGVRRRLAWSFGTLVVSAVWVFVVLGALSDRFPAGDPQLQSNLLTALLVFAVSAAGAYFVANPSQGAKSLWVATVLVLTLADLGRYFWEGNRVDQRFTAEERYRVPGSATLPLRPEVVQTLRRAWPDPDLTQGFRGGLDRALPVANHLWPENIYLIHKFEQELKDRSASVPDDPVRFVARKDGEAPTLRCAFGSWSYNGFDIICDSDGPGWLSLRQVADPLWRVTVDGVSVRPERAELVRMSVPLDRGHHLVVMDYEPKARRLYKPSCLLLETSLLCLLFAGLASPDLVGGG
jgi:hypothetical protein